ncbi:hypothetical protein E6P97_01015 [Patescibacteria group bacterium]|nr:MAG: hypothetical protein E6P97_01015 [Patescibacteria group bacterium]
MDEVTETQITIKSDKPIGIASRAHGANLDGVAFNLAFIASKNPTLATAILNSYKEAAALTENNPEHPDEDFDLALNDLEDLLK